MPKVTLEQQNMIYNLIQRGYRSIKEQLKDEDVRKAMPGLVKTRIYGRKLAMDILYERVNIDITRKDIKK